MLKPKVGDLIRMKPLFVTAADADEFRVNSVSGPYWLRNTDIEDILPGPLAVGDRVRTANGYVGDILAIDGAWAWVIVERLGRMTQELSRLTRVDPA